MSSTQPSVRALFPRINNIRDGGHEARVRKRVSFRKFPPRLAEERHAGKTNCVSRNGTINVLGVLEPYSLPEFASRETVRAKSDPSSAPLTVSCCETWVT